MSDVLNRLINQQRVQPAHVTGVNDTAVQQAGSQLDKILKGAHGEGASTNSEYRPQANTQIHQATTNETNRLGDYFASLKNLTDADVKAVNELSQRNQTPSLGNFAELGGRGGFFFSQSSSSFELGGELGARLEASEKAMLDALEELIPAAEEALSALDANKLSALSNLKVADLGQALDKKAEMGLAVAKAYIEQLDHLVSGSKLKMHSEETLLEAVQKKDQSTLSIISARAAKYFLASKAKLEGFGDKHDAILKYSDRNKSETRASAGFEKVAEAIQKLMGLGKETNQKMIEALNPVLEKHKPQMDAMNTELEEVARPLRAGYVEQLKQILNTFVDSFFGISA